MVRFGAVRYVQTVVGKDVPKGQALHPGTQLQPCAASKVSLAQPRLRYTTHLLLQHKSLA